MLGLDRGEGRAILQIQFTPLNYTLTNGSRGKFDVYFTTTLKKKKKKSFELKLLVFLEHSPHYPYFSHVSCAMLCLAEA